MLILFFYPYSILMVSVLLYTLVVLRILTVCWICETGIWCSCWPFWYGLWLGYNTCNGFWFGKDFHEVIPIANILNSSKRRSSTTNQNIVGEIYRSCNLVIMHVVIIAVLVIVIVMNCLQNRSFLFCNLLFIISWPHYGLSSLPFIILGLQDGKILTLERKQVKLRSIIFGCYVIVACWIFY